MALPFQKKYQSCTIGEFAERVGVSKPTFYSWIDKDDWHKMIDLGYLPFKNKLPPPVVKYLYDKFLSCDETEEKDTQKV